MQKEEIKLRLQKVFQDVFFDDTIEIFDDMTANDIKEWDSLNHIVLISAVEDEFKIRFSLLDISNFLCVKDLIDSILRRIEE